MSKSKSLNPNERIELIVSMPVYSGRLPDLAVKRFQALKGNGNPIMPIVVYGNRAYEDALLELCDLCTAQGFQLAGAAAFIGEHSFSSEEFPIAVNRPDQQDLEKAETFGRQLRDRLNNGHVLDIETIPGNRPYKSTPSLDAGATDTHQDECIQCGVCITSCPVTCIEMVDGFPQTRAEDCIWCMACIRSCPTNARILTLPKITESAKRLHTHFQARREPDIF